ncbi:MSCRAMM family protein [Marinobacterium aestuariivivens]|uniref:Collagen binding domain-containing protein n=1 Tax=Marinobacterium aestuariivivens TaxID=1698799 RepID=A0ABW1ZV07_9GAMM
MIEGTSGYHCADDLPLKDASLAEISYTVSETTVPDGYIGASDALTSAVFETCAERSTGSPDLTFENTSANFKLIKLDDTGAAHSGIAFTLFRDDGDLQYDPLVDTTVFDASCVTDANGECTFETVHAGNYCLVETTVLDNYIAAGPQCFSFVPGADPDLTYTFRNWRLGSILVKKTDENGAVLAGATMEITATSVADANIPPLNIALTEGPDGYHCVDGLPLKDASLGDISYTVSETGVPDGYNGAADQTTKPLFQSCDERSTGAPDLTFENERKPGAIKITKTTKDVSSDPATVAHPDVAFSIYDSSDVLIDSIVTDSDGIACLGDLDVGETYKVVETAPEGYAGETAKTVLVDDDAVCGEGNEDAVSFHNTPLGKFTISYDSLPTDGHGATKATVTCTDAGIGPVDLFDGDVSTFNSLNFESQATYNCTIVIDP